MLLLSDNCKLLLEKTTCYKNKTVAGQINLTITHFPFITKSHCVSRTQYHTCWVTFRGTFSISFLEWEDIWCALQQRLCNSVWPLVSMHGCLSSWLAECFHQGAGTWADWMSCRALVIDCDSPPVPYFTLTPWHAFLEKNERPLGWKQSPTVPRHLTAH